MRTICGINFLWLCGLLIAGLNFSSNNLLATSGENQMNSRTLQSAFVISPGILHPNPCDRWNLVKVSPETLTDISHDLNRFRITSKLEVRTEKVEPVPKHDPEFGIQSLKSKLDISSYITAPNHIDFQTNRNPLKIENYRKLCDHRLATELILVNYTNWASQSTWLYRVDKLTSGIFGFNRLT